MSPSPISVNVVGLGYVGLPLAVALAKSFATTGLDLSQSRIAELRSGYDRTNEIARADLIGSSLRLAGSVAECAPADFHIVTVPTPIDSENRPDLAMVRAAARSIGPLLTKRGPSCQPPVVVFESTVYPGVTEDVCGPILEQSSGLVCGRDFFLAYSPERINPGDREHTVDKIVKVVAGQTPEVLERVAALYGAITTGGVFRAASIKVAEAAKVIENAQRDINIAFMNEIAQIFAKLDVSVWDVLAAAQTKWNFLPFSPGLVGGHCIGVDPYYLAHRATELGHDPKVILAGRKVNDGMADWVAARLHAARDETPGTVLVLGLTFKEDVPDLRNSKVADLIAGLVAKGHSVTVHDPHANAAEARHEYGLELDSTALERRYDLVLMAVPHRAYLDLGETALTALANENGLFADLRNGLDGAGGGWRL